MIYYRQTGLSCNHIMVIKKQELYFLLKTYYTDKEIIELFYLSLNKNLTFREAVYQNYMQVKTVEELATLLGYGIKTFRKLFKENFSETPSKWIQKQILFQIKGMILEKDISFKQIMFEYKFTSSSHFYHFCHKHFGATPTQIRNGEVSITSRYIQE